MSAENGKIHATTTKARGSLPTAIKRDFQMTSNAVVTTSANNGLSRLTPARDLTLGGRGALSVVGGGGNMKKVFLPNLNAVRNKNSNVKTSKDLTATRGRRGSGRGERGGGRGAQRGGGGRGGNSSLIQTAGLFSEGAGALNIRKSFGTSDRLGEESSISQLRKPILTKTAQKINVKEEAASLQEILEDSDDGDDEFTEDGIVDMSAQKPIKLHEANWNALKHRFPMAANPIIPTTETDDPLAIAQHLQNLHVQQQRQQHQIQAEEPPTRIVYPASVAAFLEKTESQLFLMQIPETLPCVSDDEDETTRPDDKSKIKKMELGEIGDLNEMNNMDPHATKSSSKQKHNVLKDMEDGQIGKLVRYKSGKVKLILGETRFDVNMGMETGFLQELMSITTNREERSGNMINLGPIQAKLNVSPDWEYLFEQQDTGNRVAARQS